MKKSVLVLIAICVFIVGLLRLQAQPAGANDDLTIWREFAAALKKGEITPERMRPYYEQFKEPLARFLKLMREKAAWAEWEAEPEIHRLGNQVHFLIPLSFDGPQANYVFTFLSEGDQWYFQHMEAINIRLDKTGTLPTSTFPDVDEETKAHMREEIRWSREIRIFNLIAGEKGKQTALNFYMDGNGFFLAARAWVPFVEPQKAFILYSCWEEANLRGNDVTLEKLEDDEALVRMRTLYFRLYEETAHFRQQISFEDFKQIFETTWQDRARAAGWKLEIEYTDAGYKASECLLRFRKNS